MQFTVTDNNAPLLRDKRTDIVLTTLAVLQLTSFAQQLGIASQLTYLISGKTIIAQSAGRYQSFYFPSKIRVRHFNSFPTGFYFRTSVKERRRGEEEV